MIRLCYQNLRAIYSSMLFIANIDTNKIVIFWSGRTLQNLSFKYNGSEIEVVKNFNYLGIIF